MPDFRRLALASTPSLHVHFVLLDEAGNGTTTEDGYHRHEVVNGRVLPSEGHTHGLPDTFVEARGDGPLNDSVALVGLVTETPLREAAVDADERVIRNVLLLGNASGNGGVAGGQRYKGRRYLPAAMSEGVELFEGTRAYADHPTASELAERGGNRSYHDFVGVYRNVHHVAEADQVRADVHVVAGDLGDKFLDTARRMPGAVGLSIDAKGHGFVDADGVLCVEAFTEVHSVDVVDMPATTTNLFESAAALREHYAHGALRGSTPPEGATMPPNDPAPQADTKLREELETERTARTTAEAELATLREADAKRTRQAETQAHVVAVLEARPNLPELIVKRVRARFAEAEDDRATVEAYVAAELEHARALLEAHGGGSEVPEVLALDEGRKDPKPEGASAKALELVEGVIGGACGVDFKAKPKGE